MEKKYLIGKLLDYVKLDWRKEKKKRGKNLDKIVIQKYGVVINITYSIDIYRYLFVINKQSRTKLN